MSMVYISNQGKEFTLTAADAHEGVVLRVYRTSPPYRDEQRMYIPDDLIQPVIEALELKNGKDWDERHGV